MSRRMSCSMTIEAVELGVESPLLERIASPTFSYGCGLGFELEEVVAGLLPVLEKRAKAHSTEAGV